jgi:hypothetical protein
MASSRAALALALTVLTHAAAAQDVGTSAEVVVHTDGQAAASLAVRLEGAGLALAARTDQGGRALFAHLRPGPLRLAVADGPAVAIDLPAGREVRIVVDLSGALEVPRVHVEDRTLRPAVGFGPHDLTEAPRASHPWAALRSVPGLVLDRVDVGGSDLAQQALLVAPGDGGAGASWTLDGADVTDPAALGFTTVYPDVDALATLQVRTSGLDVRARTPGAHVDLLLREPAEHGAGGLHLRWGGDALQADALPSALRERGLARPVTHDVWDAGGELGGPLWGERLWLWGSAATSVLDQQTLTDHPERLSTTAASVKARLRAGNGALSLTALRSEKVDDDRDPTFTAAPAARWRQSGPSYLVALEDRRRAGSASLLAHLSWLDAGFRLEPHGGDGVSAFEDYRGIAQGSYLRLETHRPRLQAAFEAQLPRRFLGAEHEIVIGAGYRRSRVTTEESWPGNGTEGLERRSVFFRDFELTGFALLTRDQAAASVQDEGEAYVQDTARAGRVSVSLGLRLDRTAGRNLEAAVAANPSFPEWLPAVAYPGAPTEVRWLDLLPRVAFSWALDDEGRTVLRAGYGAYAAALGAGDVTFDNPIGREPASIFFYWRDQNGNHVVDPGELDAAGPVGVSGVNPQSPGSAVSPNVIDPSLRAPRTHELMGSVERSLGRHLHAAVHGFYRRVVDVEWQPLRGLTAADYAARGAVQGTLFDQAYAVVYYAPASTSRIVPGNGRVLANRGGYRQDAGSVDVSLRGEIGATTWSAWGAFMDWRESFLDRSLAVQDPTPQEAEPLQDLGRVAVRPGGFARGDVFVNARWSAGASLELRLPWELAATALASARDGFPIPYVQFADTGDPTGGSKPVLVATSLDTYRLPAVVLVDARLARTFRVRGGRLTAAIDAFNLGNAGTTLQVVRDVELPAFDRPREITRPRILRLGLAYRF